MAYTNASIQSRGRDLLARPVSATRPNAPHLAKLDARRDSWWRRLWRGF